MYVKYQVGVETQDGQRYDTTIVTPLALSELLKEVGEGLDKVRCNCKDFTLVGIDVEGKEVCEATIEDEELQDYLTGLNDYFTPTFTWYGTQVYTSTYVEYMLFNVQAKYLRPAVTFHQQGYDSDEVKTLVYAEMIKMLLEEEHRSTILQVGIDGITEVLTHLQKDAKGFTIPPRYPLTTNK